MAEYVSYLILDLSLNSPTQIIRVKQGDNNSRKIVMVLTQNNVTCQLDSDDTYTFVIAYEGGGSQSLPAYQVNNTVEVVLTSEILSTIGRHNATLTITHQEENSTAIISTVNFKIDIVQAPDVSSATSTDSFIALNDLLADSSAELYRMGQVNFRYNSSNRSIEYTIGLVNGEDQLIWEPLTSLVNFISSFGVDFSINSDTSHEISCEASMDYTGNEPKIIAVFKNIAPAVSDDVTILQPYEAPTVTLTEGKNILNFGIPQGVGIKSFAPDGEPYSPQAGTTPPAGMYQDYKFTLNDKENNPTTCTFSVYNGADAGFPPYSGDEQKFLMNDGTSVSWEIVDALPLQTGHSGKFLTTDGLSASWANIDAFPSQTDHNGEFLKTNGTTTTWSPIDFSTTAHTTTVTDEETSAVTETTYYTNIVTGATVFSDDTQSSSTSTGALQVAGGMGVGGTIHASQVYGAVWNDFAEYRISNCKEAGKCIIENGDDTLSLSTDRLQAGASIISDTFGFAIGQTDSAQTPVAVAGRVLAYLYENFKNIHPGQPVCSGPNGTVSIMSDEEARNYPWCIIGTISAIPDYEFWGENNVPVNGRVWIKVK